MRAGAVNFKVLADRMADDILSGRLPAGARLATHRAFARQHGVAASTATRVYQELSRRGLIVGEVGRGTYVRASRTPEEPAWRDPTALRIDLELNFPVQPHQNARLTASMAAFLRTEEATAALRPSATRARRHVRADVTELMSRGGWAPEEVVLTGTGRQAIAAAVAACAGPGDRIGMEQFTFPGIKGICGRLGVTAVPLEMDDEGVVPDSLRAAHRRGPLRAVYLQPDLHNPLGISIPDRRRQQLVEALDETGATVIEDGVYSFLADGAPPLSTPLGVRSLVIDSTSKRLAPGVSIGMIGCSRHNAQPVATAVRSGAWGASSFAVEATAHWVRDGTVAAIVAEKRHDARQRHALARAGLAGFDVVGDERSYHLWWRLPTRWRAEVFVAAAARHGIAITPGTAYAVQPHSTPNAVRLALSAPPLDDLTAALAKLRELARGSADDEYAALS